MKIWVIGRSYPEPGNNMTGSFELEQAKMLQKNGEDVHYLCTSFHPNKRIKAWEYQSWIDDGVKVCTYSKRFFPRIYPLYVTGMRNRFWKTLFDKVSKEDGLPDVIHVHYPAMLMIADTLKDYQQKGVKIVVTEHWTKVLSKSLDLIELKEYRKYFDFIDTCICVGSPLLHSIKEIIGDTETLMTVIPNVVDQEFQPVYKTYDGFEFIAVGRLVEVKQFDQIIQAFAECFRGKDVKLTIVGGGEEYDQLKKMVAELSMENQIFLTGALPREEVAKRIANADCLVCYSRFETFGVPIIEAWACGVPTTTTTAAAVIDTFNDKLGVEVHFDNFGELKEKMLYMYEHIGEYDKEYIAKFAQERFSEKAVCDRLMRVYVGE